MNSVAFDANPDIWDMMNLLWGKTLGVTLQHHNGRGYCGYCCDLLNSYNTTFREDSKRKDAIRLWGANGESIIVDKAIIGEDTISKVEKYARQYRSIGNVLPLPNALNSPHTGRASFKGMGDYFVNYLAFVKWHYPSDENQKDEPVFKLNLDDKGKDYFSKFESYHDYIEKNLLQPFFRDPEDRKYKTIKRLDFRKLLCGEELMNKFIDQSLLIIKERERMIISSIEEVIGKEHCSKTCELLEKLNNYLCEM